MRITLLCVGRLGTSPENLLARDYVARATATGRALGLSPVELVEVESRKPGRPAEAEALLARIEGAKLIACDERGENLTSRDLAQRIGRWRDDGEARIVFAVGGADGLDRAVTEAAAGKIAFGAATWPHALARVMLAEQIYRAASILAGAPYHRD